MPVGLDALRGQARLAHPIQQEVTAATDIAVVTRVRRNRRDADVVLQLVQVGLALGVHAFESVSAVCGHVLSSEVPSDRERPILQLRSILDSRVPVGIRQLGESVQIDGVDDNVGDDRGQQRLAPCDQSGERQARNAREQSPEAEAPARPDMQQREQNRRHDPSESRLDGSAKEYLLGEAGE